MKTNPSFDKSSAHPVKRAKDVLLGLVIGFVALDLWFVIKGGYAGWGHPALLMAIWISKLLLLVGGLGIGYLIYRLRTNLARTGFFDERSIVALKGIVYVTLGLTIFYASQQALRDLQESQVLYGHRLRAESGVFLVSNFLGYLLGKVPFLLLFALLLFLLNDFTRRAIAVKRENESFI